MKKLIILITLCIMTQTLWGKDCLSKEAIKLAKATGYLSSSDLALQMMIYEGRLNGDFLELLKEFKRKVDVGHFDNAQHYQGAKKRGRRLHTAFLIIMSPDMFDTPNKLQHFENYFGPKWGPIALKLHQEKGDIYTLLDGHKSANKEIKNSIDEKGCLNL